MKNVRNLLAAALLVAVAACSGDATAPDAARHPSGPRLQKVTPDTIITPPADPADGLQGEGEGDGRAPDGGLIGSSG